MVELYLVRHGECKGKGSYIGGGSDFPLTDEGKEQIHFLGYQYFKNLDVDEFYCSPQVRAKESAAILNKFLDSKISYLEGLKESNFGLWEGFTFSEISKNWNKEYSSWIENPIGISPPQGESLEDVEKRVMPLWEQWEDLIEHENQHKILIVSHRGPLTLLILQALGLSLDSFWNFQISRGSVSKLTLYPRHSELTYLNLTAVP